MVLARVIAVLVCFVKWIFVSAAIVSNVYTNKCHDGRRNEMELVGMEFGRDYNREDIEGIADTMIFYMVRLGCPDWLFVNTELKTYLANKLEYVYLQGRLQGREDCKEIAEEVF